MGHWIAMAFEITGVVFLTLAIPIAIILLVFGHAKPEDFQ